MTGIATVYGIGVGPGDPKLLTLRAAEVLRSAGLVMAPRASAGHDSVALGIVREHVPGGCKVVEAVFPMSNDRGERNVAARDAADLLATTARSGLIAVMVALGDAMTYSTWGYVLRELRARHADIPVETVPGITSFAAAAARLGEPLAEGSDPLLVWPGSPPDNLGDLLTIAPNMVALKVGRDLQALLAAARSAGARAAAVRRLGMKGEQTALDAADLLGGPTDYFTTAIVHKENQ
ncbi:MAG: precorrin-2 C(20)-methyltransferase [Thermoleophilia bacterium]